MISNEVINAIDPLLLSLNKAGYRVTPADVSPVCALNTVSYTPLVDQYIAETGFTELWLKSLTKMPVLGIGDAYEITDGDITTTKIPLSQHSATMDEAVDVVASSVQRAMDFARNTASPIINKVIDNVNDRIADSETSKEKFSLVEVNLHEAWNSPVVLTALEQHKFDVVFIPRNEIPPITVPDDEYFVSLFKTGTDNIDELFDSLIKDTGVSPAQLFTELFHGNGDVGHVNAPVFKHRNQTLLCYLLVSLMTDNPVPNSGLSSMEWETLMLKLSNTLGALCNDIATWNDGDIEDNKLIHHIDWAKDIVYLNGPIYDKFIDADGSPEVIFGALINFNNDYSKLSFDSLLADRDIYLGSWSGWHSSNEMLLNSKRHENIKDSIYKAVIIELGDVDSTSLPKGSTTDDLISLAGKCVNRLSQEETDDPGKACMKITCEVMFSHTPTHYFLSRINELCETYEDPAEAATEVVIEYIADWIVSGLNIIKHSV